MSIAGIEDTEWPTSGKLTEAEVNARAVMWEHEHAAAFFAVKSYDACKSGPCAGGAKPCPSPEACQRAAQDFCGYTWADRLANRFWALPMIDKAGPGFGLGLVVASAVTVVGLLVAAL